MKTMLYLFIAAAFIARASLFIYFYATKRRRMDDVVSGIGLFLLGLSYACYALTVFTKLFVPVELALDGILGVIAVTATVRAYWNALKEKKK